MYTHLIICISKIPRSKIAGSKDIYIYTHTQLKVFYNMLSRARPIGCPDLYSFQPFITVPKHFILTEKQNRIFCLNQISYKDFCDVNCYQQFIFSFLFHGIGSCILTGVTSEIIQDLFPLLNSYFFPAYFLLKVFIF